jgi:hypothetical protein
VWQPYPDYHLWRGRPGLASRRHLAGGMEQGKMPSPHGDGFIPKILKFKKKSSNNLNLLVGLAA